MWFFSSLMDGLKQLKFVVFFVTWFLMSFYWIKQTVQYGIYGMWLNNILGFFISMVLYPVSFFVFMLLYYMKINRTKDYIHIIGPDTDLWAVNEAGTAIGYDASQSVVLRLLNNPKCYEHTDVLKSFGDPDTLDEEDIQTIKVNLSHRVFSTRNLWVLKGPARRSQNPEYSYETSLDGYFNSREMLQMYKELQHKTEYIATLQEHVRDFSMALRRSGSVVPEALDNLIENISMYRNKTNIPFKGEERELEYMKAKHSKYGYNKYKTNEIQNKLRDNERENEELRMALKERGDKGE